MQTTQPASTYRQASTRGERHLPGESQELQGNTANMIFPQSMQELGREDPSLFLSETISRIHKQQYFISPRLLVGTPISEYKRAVLRFWIYEQSAKLTLDRNTVAIANTLVDLFFEKGGEVSVEELQTLGIAALLLGKKCSCREVQIPTNENVFPRRLLNQFQGKLCKTLKFKLTPVTYVQVLDELICAWNNFAQRHSDLWSYKIGAKGRVFSSRSMYELMDVIFMVATTYTYDLFELTLGVFRVFLIRDHELLSSRPKPIQDEVIISFWNNPEDEPLMSSSIENIFQHFLHFIQQNPSEKPHRNMSLQPSDKPHHNMSLQPAFNTEITYYIQSFLQAGFQSSITRDLISQTQSDRQSFSPIGLQVARRFISVKKNNRKSSSETLAI